MLYVKAKNSPSIMSMLLQGILDLDQAIGAVSVATRAVDRIREGAASVTTLALGLSSDCLEEASTRSWSVDLSLPT